jgi:hypothetical protein
MLVRCESLEPVSVGSKPAVRHIPEQRPQCLSKQTFEGVRRRAPVGH